LLVRIGIDTGPVVAGVIGRSKFSHDRWATPATPPAASRPTGARVHPGDRPHLLAAPGRYRFQRRGPVLVKGMGEMVTYFQLGGNQRSADRPRSAEHTLAGPQNKQPAN
jgi:adenylate cyclase